MTEEWLGGALLACGAAIASTSPGTQNQQNERCASGRPLIQLPGPGGDAELGPQALDLYNRPGTNKGKAVPSRI